ncbi:MAG: molybdopterin-dependent oxidoreductase [Desulfobacteraceae bacterium]|jgi:anaerobic selenocysteine-containing dehydrogenase
MEQDRKNLKELIAFNRRNFIKLLVGGAVGIHVSPLPWKLTDDIAIWTQNWPWLPVPPVGEFSHADSVCTLCSGGCGIHVRKVDARPVKIEGRTDYPVNPGGICPLGAGSLQLLYNENIRFTGPMKRVGPRGSGTFTPVSWDEALETLSDRIVTLRRKGRPEALVAVDGNPGSSTAAHLIQRFLDAVGSPHYTRVPTAEDTYAMVNWLMQGSEGPVAYDLENADFILSFGCGLIEGWGAPGRVLNAWGLWHSAPLKGKVKIVQIESRASNTASKADQWLAPLPGTEAALALGLAHVIIEEGLYDAAFVHNHSFGFTDWTSADNTHHFGFKSMVLRKYSPEAVAKITGLDARQIVSLARSFARAKAPIALCGKGKGDLNGSLFEFMAIQSLNALVGNINQPGGVLVHDPLPLNTWPKVEVDWIARRGLTKTRLDQAGSRHFPFTQSLINDLAETIAESDVSPVDTLLVFSANPAHTIPDGGAFKKAIKKIPFVVSFSPFKDEAALMADLIMPDHTYLEKTEDVVWPTGLQYPLYGLTQPVLQPLYDTRHSGDLIIKVAKMIGGTVATSFPWKNYEDALKARAKGLFESEGGLTTWDASEPVWKNIKGRGPVNPDYTSFDDMWKKIKASGLWYRPAHNFKNWESIFKTPTGKFEFSSSRIELAVGKLAKQSSLKSALLRMGIGAEGDEAFMPHYEEAPSGGDEKEYPLLMVPYSLINLSSAWSPNPPYLNKTLFDHQLRKNDSFADINPETAFEYNLKQGDRVMIQSPKGKVEARINLFEGAMPGVLYLPVGFGHTAYDAFQRDKGVNPNEIVDGGKDPLSGQPVWWRTPVKISKHKAS